MSAGARPLKAAIALDGFAGLAGAEDFVVSLADAMERTRGINSLVAIYRRPGSQFNPRRLVAWAIRSIRAVAQGRAVPALTERVDIAAAVERMRRGGLPDLEVLICGPREAALRALCRRHEIDALIPLTAAPSARFPIPWVGYIFDFQHRALPGYFPLRERRRRDRMFGALLAKAPTVIVNACNVRDDASKFLGPFPAEPVVMPFSACPRPDWFERDVATVRARWNIGPRYFMISNQFWIHKRHDLALRAFSVLAAERPEPELVCTGAIDDWRAPDYFSSLQRFIAEAGLDRRVHILGLIDKRDQIALMRGAVAVIQPTEFEGGPGGGAVFDAVSLGVPTVVSDIAVNREISNYITRYFAPGDQVALAAAMRAVLDLPTGRLDPADLLAAGAARREAMGRALWYAVDRAMEVTRARRVRTSETA
ncbi:MAG: glycosyltransferase [Novosphingobium sp.]